MNRLKQIDLDKIENKLISIGIDISLADSLVNFLNGSTVDVIEISETDKANLLVILKRILTSIKKKYEKIERIFEL